MTILNLNRREKVVKKKAEQTVTQLAQKLRKQLPGQVEKVNDPDRLAYIIDNKVGVEINYSCKWNMGEKKPTQKQCYPAYITVRLDGNYLSSRKYYPDKNRVFRSQTIRPNAVGEFPLDRVLVAITKAVTATSAYIKRAEARELVKRNKERRLNDKMDDLGSSLPPSFKATRNKCGFADAPDSAERCTFVSVAKGDELEDEDDTKGSHQPIEFSYSVDAEGFTKEDLLAVVTVLEVRKKINQRAKQC